MSFLRGCAVGVLVTGLSGLGCSSVSNYGAPPPCQGNHCGGPAGGGVVHPDGGGAGGAGGSLAGSSDVTGTVHKITDSAFDDLVQTSFTGAATITALPAGAATITTPYGGAAGTTFTLPNVPAGLTWLWVQDASMGGSDVLSTFSQVSVPALAAAPLPVIELSMMTTIANSLPSVAAKGVSANGSQIILILSHLSLPYKGVTVSGGAAGAQIVYDLGPGTYTDTGTATGAAGTVILFNSGISGQAVITLTDTNAMPMTQYQLPVQSATGSATIVRAELQ